MAHGWLQRRHLLSLAGGGLAGGLALVGLAASAAANPLVYPATSGLSTGAASRVVISGSGVSVGFSGFSLTIGDPRYSDFGAASAVYAPGLIQPPPIYFPAYGLYPYPVYHQLRVVHRRPQAHWPAAHPGLIGPVVYPPPVVGPVLIIDDVAPTAGAAPTVLLDAVPGPEVVSGAAPAALAAPLQIQVDASSPALSGPAPINLPAAVPPPPQTYRLEGLSPFDQSLRSLEP